MQPESKYAWLVITASAILVLVFHFLDFDVPFGWPMVLWTVLLGAFLIGMRSSIKTPVNAWAYLFLVPVMFVLIAELVYANNAVHVFGIVLSALSYWLFAYWLYAPKTNLHALENFWPRTWIQETLLPLDGRGPLSKIGMGQGSRQALFGVLVAIPFVLVFAALFLSADPLIGKVVSGFISLDNPGKLFVQLMVDVLLAFYLTRWIWMAFTRTVHQRHPEWFPLKVDEQQTLFISFLAVLNVLFLVFIGFQFVYFFGGQAIVESYGLTYSSYAREGFFQLFTVSFFVFLIVYGFMAKTHAKSLAVRLLSIGLIVESWVVIASAIKRLTLYVGAYGLSVQRYWALAGLMVIALGLLVLAGWLVARASFKTLDKTMSLGLLVVFSGLLLFNFESFIVNWNASRLPTESVAPDFVYPVEMSSDAVPAYVAWLKSVDDMTAIPCASTIKYNALFVRSDCTLGIWKQYLRTDARKRLEENLSDPRKRTWSGMKALEAYEQL